MNSVALSEPPEISFEKTEYLFADCRQIDMAERKSHYGDPDHAREHRARSDESAWAKTKVAEDYISEVTRR
jgi:hypothetical protein